jgi:hypothetical protein
MRQLSVDPSLLLHGNSGTISTTQQYQHHSSAPQTPLAGESERHVPFTSQKSVVNNGTAKTDSELEVV